MKKDLSKKLTLNTAVVRKLQQDLTDVQLQQIAGGLPAAREGSDGCGGSRAGVC